MTAKKKTTRKKAPRKKAGAAKAKAAPAVHELALPAQMTIRQVKDLAEPFAEASQAAGDVTLKLTEVESVDVVGLQLLLGLANTLKQAGRKLRVEGCQGPVKDAMAAAAIPWEMTEEGSDEPADDSLCPVF